MPEPDLVRATDVAEPFCITPEKVVDVLSLPEVKVSVPLALLVIDPTPEIEPTVSENPPKSNVPVTTKALASAIRSESPSFKVPAEMVVVPV